MKKFCFAVILVVFSCQSISAQITISKIGGNLGTNLFLGDSKFHRSTISPNIGVFAIFEYSDLIDVKIQTGFGKMGINWPNRSLITSFIPVEVTGIFSISKILGFEPFVLAGIGAFGFTVNGSSRYYDGEVIGGAGFSYPLNSKFTLITTADVRYTSGDHFNGTVQGMKDGFISLQTGIGYNFNKNEKKYKMKEMLKDLEIIAQNPTNPSIEATIKPPIEADLFLENERITELMNELKNELKNELINELINVTKNELKNELKSELINELKNVTKNELINEPENIIEEKPVVHFAIIPFEFNMTELTENSKIILSDMINDMNLDKSIVVEIQGYTDSTGDESYNKDLSQYRAESIRDYLIRRGIKPERLITNGYGEQFPIASNSTREGRIKNRRVEFALMEKYSKIITEVKK